MPQLNVKPYVCLQYSIKPRTPFESNIFAMFRITATSSHPKALHQRAATNKYCEGIKTGSQPQNGLLHAVSNGPADPSRPDVQSDQSVLAALAVPAFLTGHPPLADSHSAKPAPIQAAGLGRLAPV